MRSLKLQQTFKLVLIVHFVLNQSLLFPNILVCHPVNMIKVKILFVRDINPIAMRFLNHVESRMAIP